MRDIALSLVIISVALLAFKNPAWAAYLWAWLSMMNPHKLTYGFAFNMPFAQFSAIVAFIVVLITQRKRAPPMEPIVGVQLTMVVWMSLTCFFALADKGDVWDRWLFVFKIHLMIVVTWMLVRTKEEIRILIWVVTLSVTFYGIKGGVFTVLSGGGERVWGPPGGLIQGNNELAVALVMLMPFLYYLRQTDKRAWVRHLLTFFIISCAFSILGTQSRGALLSLVSMAFFLGLKSKYPVRTSIAMILLVMAAIGFMPDTWTNRMETIGEFRTETSALSRLWTWTTLWNAAVDRPITGVGFRADNPLVFGLYAPTHPPYDIFIGQIWVAHSIYFQMLGEHGFVGLALFLTLVGTVWIRAGRVAKQSLANPDTANWMPLLMRMVQVSIIGYLVGGAFLSLAYLDIIYYIFGYVVLCGALLRESKGAAVPKPAAAGVVARPGMPGLPGRSHR